MLVRLLRTVESVDFTVEQLVTVRRALSMRA